MLAGPWIIYQLWTFVAAGLYPHEKNVVHLFSAGEHRTLSCRSPSRILFFVFDFVLTYLLAFNEWLGLDPDPRISEWLGFVLFLPVGFGLGFQLPLVMVFLDRLGIVEVKNIREPVAYGVRHNIYCCGDTYAGRSVQHATSCDAFGGALLWRHCPLQNGLTNQQQHKKCRDGAFD